MHVEGVRGVENARARCLGHNVYADMDVIVDQQLTVEEAVHTRERKRLYGVMGLTSAG